MRMNITMAALALASCAVQEPAGTTAPNVVVDGHQTFFECSDSEWAVKLIGTPDGKLVLSTDRQTRRGAVGTAASDSLEVREGYVTGQGGGYQSHIRLYDGFRQIMLFEGLNGSLASDPGRTYAGAFTTTEKNPAQDFRIACAADGMNARMVENVRAWAERTGGPVPVPEDEGGDWDGWF